MIVGVRRRAGRLVAALPRPLRAGFAVLAVGLLADLAYHLVPAAGGHAGPGPLVTHGVVIVGVGLSLAGIAISAVAGAGHTGRAERPAGRRGT
jgi:hypothetical protein